MYILQKINLMRNQSGSKIFFYEIIGVHTLFLSLETVLYQPIHPMRQLYPLQAQNQPMTRINK